MKDIFALIKPFMVKHEPELLTGLGVSGLVFSTGWGIKATVSFTKAMEAKKKELQVDKLPAKEFWILIAKYYWPVAVSTAVSIPCIVAGNRVYSKRNAALAAAYTLSETALQQYEGKVTELLGDKKAQEIHEAVSADTVDKTYKQGDTNVIVTGDGDSLFYEPLTDRYFKTNWNKVLAAANELNAEAATNINGYITLTDWFYKLGLEQTDISDDLGWSIGKHGANGLIKVSIDSHLTSDNIPCGAIYYINKPEYLSWD